MKVFIAVLFAVALAALPLPAPAGSSETGKTFLPAAQVAAFADRVQRDLAARGAHVAIVARVGRDRSQLPAGVEYTHVGFWVFSRITRSDGSTGTGYRVYNLYQNQDDPSHSRLVQDGPAEFLAGVHDLDVGIIIPDRRLQKKLLAVIASPTYAALHNRNYAVLSNPETSRYQNCTEHALDILMASLYGTGDVRRIKANIAAHFESQPIPMDGFKRFLASTTSRALTTADHGTEVRTATFESIARFMKANALAAEIYRLTPAGTQRL
jgi:hypothetical protein